MWGGWAVYTLLCTGGVGLCICFFAHTPPTVYAHTCIHTVYTHPLQTHPLHTHPQHYILKTIENIASQQSTWTTLMTTTDLLTVLCTLWLDAAGDEATNPTSTGATAVQIAAASTLSRLFRWSPASVGHVMHMLGAATVVDGVWVVGVVEVCWG